MTGPLSRPEDASRADLTDPVRKALDDPMAQVVDWSSSVLGGGYSGSSVRRFSGTARQGDALAPWSLILKVLRPENQDNDPTHWQYWRREVEVWKSGLLDSLPPCLAAPRHYSVVEQVDAAWMWLEDLPGPNGRDWPVERLALAAQHAGTWQGVYLAGRPMPDHPWLTRGFVHQWAEVSRRAIWKLVAARDDPAVRRYWPGDVYERALALSAEAPRLLEAVDRVPLVVGHGDLQPGNLFGRRGSNGLEVTAIIDWSIAGLAPVGREISNLVALSALNFGAEPSWLRSFEEAVYESYLQGLRDAGWAGDELVVRFGHTASLGLAGGLHLWGVEAVGDEQRARMERAWGLPYEEVLERNARARSFCLDLADEARELMPSIQ